MSGRGGRGSRTELLDKLSKRTPNSKNPLDLDPAKVLSTSANSYAIQNEISNYIDKHLSYTYDQSGEVLTNKDQKLSVSFDTVRDSEFDADKLKALLIKEITEGANLEGLAPLTINEQTFAGTRTSTTTDGAKYEVDSRETEQRIDEYIENGFIRDLFSEAHYEDLKSKVRYIKYYETPDAYSDERIPYFEMELEDGEVKELRVDWAPHGLKGRALRPSDLETYLWQETPLSSGTYYRENGMPRGWRAPGEPTAKLYVYADVWEGEWNPETNQFFHDKIEFEPEHTVLRKLSEKNSSSYCSEAVVIDVKASYSPSSELEYIADADGKEVVYSDNKIAYILAEDPAKWPKDSFTSAYKIVGDNTLVRIGGTFDN